MGQDQICLPLSKSAGGDHNTDEKTLWLGSLYFINSVGEWGHLELFLCEDNVLQWQEEPSLLLGNSPPLAGVLNTVRQEHLERA